MENVGKVEAILDNSHVILSANTELRVNLIVTIVSEIKDEAVTSKLGITSLLFPKGQLRILFAQGNQKYLAGIYREEREKTKVIKTPNSLAKQLLGVSSLFQDEQKEVTETVVGPPSARLNSEESLNINFSNTISVGDLVMR